MQLCLFFFFNFIVPSRLKKLFIIYCGSLSIQDIPTKGRNRRKVAESCWKQRLDKTNTQNSEWDPPRVLLWTGAAFQLSRDSANPAWKLNASYD